MQYLLDNISTTTLDAIAARDATPETQLMLMLEKIILSSDNVARELRPYADVLRTAAKHDGVAILRYYTSKRNPDHEALDEFLDMMGPEGESAMTTFLDDYRSEIRTEALAEGEARGRAEGIAQGEAKGEAKGRVEGRREALSELLAARFGRLPGAVTAAIRRGTPDELRTWLARAGAATELDDIFAE